MRCALLTPFLVACALTACQVQHQTRIRTVSDLPLKDTNPPDFDWQNAPLRANAQYILFKANSEKDRKAMLGDYYFVDWYDAAPDKPAEVVMYYTQGKTGPEVQKKVIAYKEPRRHAGSHKERFFFNGADRAVKGDILTWRIEVYSDGKLMDSKQSYLWE